MSDEIPDGEQMIIGQIKELMMNQFISEALFRDAGGDVQDGAD